MTHLPICTCNIFLTLFLEFSSFIKTRIPNYQKINQYESFANWNRHVLLSRHYVRVVRLMQQFIPRWVWLKMSGWFIYLCLRRKMPFNSTTNSFVIVYFFTKFQETQYPSSYSSLQCKYIRFFLLFNEDLNGHL